MVKLKTAISYFRAPGPGNPERDERPKSTKALSAYTMNFGSSRFSGLEDALLNFGGFNGYSPVDLSV